MESVIKLLQHLIDLSHQGLCIDEHDAARIGHALVEVQRIADADPELCRNRLQAALERGDDLANMLSPSHDEVLEWRKFSQIAWNPIKNNHSGGEVAMLEMHKAALTAERNHLQDALVEAQRVGERHAAHIAILQRFKVRALTVVEQLAERLPVGRLRASALDWVRETRRDDDAIPF